MTNRNALLAALQEFAKAVTAKLSQLTQGEPEDQLRGPFENLMRAVGVATNQQVVCTGETKVAGTSKALIPSCHKFR